ncbi:MAG: hypothetical protein M1828_006566 [Chrysothrix sp. TS-e1954]|nr:MAG: hypothetical protein M1828_006566 [Chrysothrix sp. TS-e1954]
MGRPKLSVKYQQPVNGEHLPSKSAGPTPLDRDSLSFLRESDDLDQEHPKKRRKLSEQHENDVDHVTTSSNKSKFPICLADVTLSLANESAGLTSDDHDQPIPVTLLELLRCDSQDHSYTIRLCHSPARSGSRTKLIFHGSGVDKEEFWIRAMVAVSLAPKERLCVDAALCKVEVESVPKWNLRTKLLCSTGTPIPLRSDHDSISPWFDSCFPEAALQPQTSGTLAQQDFYHAAHVSDPDSPVYSALQETPMMCDLFPFQQRAVSWMLRREHAALEDKQLGALSTLGVKDASFSRTRDAHGRTCFVSHLLGVVQAEEAATTFTEHNGLRGGILAEEMGLGKTVELAALISTHRRRNFSPLKAQDSRQSLTPSGATLIITPSHILEQWKNELAAHAPLLKVFHYEGAKRYKGAASLDELLDHDVVLSTYDVLTKEIYYAQAPHTRSLRNTKKYEARRSPLITIDWWRVCLDEAQQIESGVSNAAQVAKLISRRNAWAVTGTPIKKGVDDLRGLLDFLALEPYCRKAVFDRMVNSYRHVFVDLFSAITIRHTKSDVHKELTLPPQDRFVISMPFTAVEEQHYGELFKEMCKVCGLDCDGAPLAGDWNPDSAEIIEKMQSWLVRLRQTCLHPEVGGRNRKALGARVGALRTVAEVLDFMIEQNDGEIHFAERRVIEIRLLRGHLMYFGRKFEQAWKIYCDASAQAEAAVVVCRERLANEKLKRRSDQDTHRSTHSGDSSSALDTEDQDSQDSHVKAYYQRLRSVLELQHACHFFVATGFYAIRTYEDEFDKESEYADHLELLEIESYEKAGIVRKELMSDISAHTREKMAKVDSLVKESLTTVSSVEYFQNFRGIQSRRIVSKIDSLVELLNANGEKITEWRDKLTHLLLAKLVDQEDDGDLTGEDDGDLTCEDKIGPTSEGDADLTDEGVAALTGKDDTNLTGEGDANLTGEEDADLTGEEDADRTGEEYEESTRVQDEQHVMLLALRTLVADRETMMTGLANFLVNNEAIRALRFAKCGEGHAPALMVSTLKKREKIKPNQIPESSARGLMAELRSLIHSVRRPEEVDILQQELANLRKLSASETKTISALQEELDLFTSTLNSRVDFHRQLQVISDTVVPLQSDFSETFDEVRFAEEVGNEARWLDGLAALKTKRRYLDHLKHESSGEEAPRDCIICQSPFENGILTICGHIVCKECMSIWRSQRHNCPTCKRHISASDMHAITYKPKDLQARKEQHDNVVVKNNLAKPQTSPIYSSISTSDLDAIKNIELRGSYGTKIDTLARHLLWIRERYPGTQSVIFSQFRDFLNILGDALQHFKISYVDAANRKSGKSASELFKKTPSIECYLLHAKANSSGLNLTNATNVFICEPLINPSIELQAIARVHRIGQRSSTTVWMYLVNDTVEEAIYEISVGRRLAHMKSKGSSGTSRAATPGPLEESSLEQANSLQLQANPVAELLAKGKSAGEVVAKDDLWQCFFKKTNKPKKAPEQTSERLLTAAVRAEAVEQRSAAM